MLLLAAACALLVIPLNQQTSNHDDTLDFANFYTAGRIVNQGEASRLYDLGLQRRVERAASPGAGPFQPYLHPPFDALLFAPFASFTYPHAFLLWAALNLLVIGLIVYLVRAIGYRLSTTAYAIWMGIFLFFVLGALALGQDTLLLVAVFLLAFLALKRRRDFAAGLVLGLGLFRFEILLPFAFVFLLRRRWSVLAGFCAMGAAEFAVSAALVGWTGLAGYVRALAEVGSPSASSWEKAANLSISMMPSLHGAFGALFGDVISQRFQFPVVLVATVVLLGWVAWDFRDVDRPETPAFDLEYSLAVIAALLAGYHIFLSELAPLIVVGLLVLAYEDGQPRKGIWKNREGMALLLLVFAVVGGAALVHSQAFSLEVIVLLGLMAWLSREVSGLRRAETAAR